MAPNRGTDLVVVGLHLYSMGILDLERHTFTVVARDRSRRHRRMSARLATTRGAAWAPHTNPIDQLRFSDTADWVVDAVHGLSRLASCPSLLREINRSVVGS